VDWLRLFHHHMPLHNDVRSAALFVNEAAQRKFRRCVLSSHVHSSVLGSRISCTRC